MKPVRSPFAKLALGLGIVAIATVGGIAATRPAPTKVFGSIEPGRYEKTMPEGTLTRSYILRVPKSYDPKRPTPLVVVLHGFTATAKIAEVYTGMADKAEKEGYIAIFPDGSGKTEGWNAGFLNLGVGGADDVKFIGDVLDQAEKDLNVDVHRVYVAGHSSGGMMANLLGAKLGKRLAAIAPVSGAIGFDRGTNPPHIPDPEAPLSVILFHSIPDNTVAYDHGDKILLKNVISAPDTAKWWAAKDGCGLTAKRLTLNDGDNTVDTYTGGKDGTEVVLVTSVKGSHDWPGGIGLSGNEKASRINAADMIFDFFNKHARK